MENTMAVRMEHFYTHMCNISHNRLKLRRYIEKTWAAPFWMINKTPLHTKTNVLPLRLQPFRWKSSLAINADSIELVKCVIPTLGCVINLIFPAVKWWPRSPVLRQPHSHASKHWRVTGDVIGYKSVSQHNEPIIDFVLQEEVVECTCLLFGVRPDTLLNISYSTATSLF